MTTPTTTADQRAIDRASIEQQIADNTATERPQGARVVWRHEALRIALGAYDLGYTGGYHEGQLHGYDAAQAEGRRLVEAETARTDDVQAQLDALVDVAYAARGGTTTGDLSAWLDKHHPRESGGEGR